MSAEHSAELWIAFGLLITAALWMYGSMAWYAWQDRRDCARGEHRWHPDLDADRQVCNCGAWYESAPSGRP